MEDHVRQLKNYLEPAVEDKPEDGKIRAQEVASISMTVYTFMDFMFDEIERTGFQGPEFLSKSELFLKAVTPSYPLKNFEEILTTLNKVDNRFPQTKFYKGFQGLRSLCSGDYEATIEIMSSSGVGHVADKNVVDKNLIFFGTFLIEQIIRYIKKLRNSPDLSKMSTKDFRKAIDDQFDHCVINTVTQL